MSLREGLLVWLYLSEGLQLGTQRLVGPGDYPPAWSQGAGGLLGWSRAAFSTLSSLCLGALGAPCPLKGCHRPPRGRSRSPGGISDVQPLKAVLEHQVTCQAPELQFQGRHVRRALSSLQETSPEPDLPAALSVTVSEILSFSEPTGHIHTHQVLHPILSNDPTSASPSESPNRTRCCGPGAQHKTQFINCS